MVNLVVWDNHHLTANKLKVRVHVQGVHKVTEHKHRYLARERIGREEKKNTLKYAESIHSLNPQMRHYLGQAGRACPAGTSELARKSPSHCTNASCVSLWIMQKQPSDYLQKHLSV